MKRTMARLGKTRRYKLQNFPRRRESIMGSLRMPNLRGKALHNSLFPALNQWGGAMLRRDGTRAEQNRAQRLIRKSNRTPWRRPKPVYDSKGNTK
jgi:hypothetical protein